MSKSLVTVRHSARRASGYANRKGRLSLTESSHADLQHLLGELALALLPRGITPKSFSILARGAFVRAAAANSRLKNGKVNHSKVAAITGLPRKEVRRMLNRTGARLEPDMSTRMPSERVVQGWLTDQRFLTQKGGPKSLLFEGTRFSFRQLVKEYGGDISPRAVLEDLVDSRRVHHVGERLKLQISKLPTQTTGLGALTRVIPSLVDGLRIASRRPTSSIDSSLYRLKLHAPSTVELALLRERCSTSIQSMLCGLSESLEHQLTVPPRKHSSSRHMLTVTVLLVDAGPAAG